VYKVLALNCLVSAYMMSALYLRGLKQGATQMTATGLVIAGLFFLLSQAKPVLHISAQKPTSTIFARAVLTSLLGQFAVHFVSLLYFRRISSRENYPPNSSSFSCSCVMLMVSNRNGTSW
jgi:manganese-transporting P-type ATPase